MQNEESSRTRLVATASELVQPPIDTAMAHRVDLEQWIAKVDHALLQRPDLESLIGQGNIELMKDNHRNHALFMNSLFFGR
jgi:hypothetical protein